MAQKVFTKEEQLDLFTNVLGAPELLREYIESGRELCDEAQVKLYELDAPFNEDLIVLYVEKGYLLSEEAEARLFDLPLGEMLVETYCFEKDHYLQPKAQLKLLQMPDKKLAQRYIRFNKKTPYLSAEFIDQAKQLGLM